jgi:hypothetical protein
MKNEKGKTIEKQMTRKLFECCMFDELLCSRFKSRRRNMERVCRYRVLLSTDEVCVVSLTETRERTVLDTDKSWGDRDARVQYVRRDPQFFIQCSSSHGLSLHDVCKINFGFFHSIRKLYHPISVVWNLSFVKQDVSISIV